MTQLTSPIPRDPATFSTTLPYSFDTSKIWGNALKGGMLLTLFLGVCFLAALLIGHFLAALQLAICCALMSVAVRVARKLEIGSVGTITRDAVEVHQGTLFGRALPGPSGTYPIAQFKAVLIKIVSPSPSQHLPNSRSQSIYLIGDGIAPTILIGSEDMDSQLGQELAILLNLPLRT